MLAVVSGIVPDEFGQVFVDLTLKRGLVAYVNAMRVEVVPLAVSQQPTDLVVDTGGTLAFTAGIVGSLPGITLQWERDGVPLVDDARVSGATTDTLTIQDASALDSGAYRLVASSGATSVQTEVALGGVRLPGGNGSDFNNDGVVNQQDVIDFLGEIE
jgi:hypothetical protein